MVVYCAMRQESVLCRFIDRGDYDNSQSSNQRALCVYTGRPRVNEIDNETYNSNKKLSYCWETVRRESMPRIAEMDVEMTT